MLDNRWLWGTSYPKRPSIIHFVVASIYLTTAGLTIVLMQVYDENTTLYDKYTASENPAEYMYVVCLVVNGLLLVLLAYKQHFIEQRRIYDPQFNIDEIELRINHYFKMQESIKSFLGFVTLLVGLIKTFFAYSFVLSKRQSQYKPEGYPDKILAFVEIFCVLNLVILAVVYLVFKLSWQVLQACCPLIHMKLRQSIHRKQF